MRRARLGIRMLRSMDSSGNTCRRKHRKSSRRLNRPTRWILLWHQIQIAYAAIIRAQRIAYVKDQQDKTIEKIENKEGNVFGEKWEVQQAWDKQNEFLKAQARAQGELRNMIKQYDEMLHKNWEAASEEQRARIQQLKAQADKISRENGNEDQEDGVEIINDAPKETGTDI